MSDTNSSAVTPEDYISVYMPIAGWKAIHYHYNIEDIPGEGFWEPWATSDIAFMAKAAAIAYGKKWAEDLGLEFRDNDPENTADAPNESVIEQLKNILGDTFEFVELK